MGVSILYFFCSRPVPLLHPFPLEFTPAIFSSYPFLSGCRQGVGSGKSEANSFFPSNCQRQETGPWKLFKSTGALQEGKFKIKRQQGTKSFLKIHPQKRSRLWRVSVGRAIVGEGRAISPRNVFQECFSHKAG
ncbi:uncharacterized protein TM35_000051090 [Trypanosoma theileri]|uniref:Uncharacterized protein n=1 Tax=Trypanosoma theileri TaxID=67003 RepID=A0A1X0P4C9_9TRYP|nr:uncharacterized protein TM35_000051090 [Trypanosoma theileri]ORC91513.1 hypothetical protein TM35_000051090 [Trypanosoma theileri]